jgi:hypothetical protein
VGPQFKYRLYLMLDQVQDAIIADAKQHLPGLAQVEPYVGQFGPDGPNQGLVSAPAFFVAVLAAPPAAQQPGDGRLSLDARWSAYCLARNARGPESRGRDAMSMATSWALRLNDLPQWGMEPSVSQPEIEGVQNLYSAALDKKGFALWAVTWRQVVMVGESIWDGDGETPSEVWFGWQPETFPEDYEQLQNSEAPGE